MQQKSGRVGAGFKHAPTASFAAFRINKETAQAAEGIIFVRMLGLQLCHSTWHGHLARVDSSAYADAAHRTKRGSWDSIVGSCRGV